MLSAIPFDIGQKQLARFFEPQKFVAQKTVKKPAGHTVMKKIVARQPVANEALKNADWNTRAVSLWQQARFTDSQQAVALLQKAIQEDPGFAEAYNNRGNAYRDMKDYARAMQDYNKALSLDPELEQTYNNRGNIYYDQRNYQMAVRDYNTALSLKADYPLAYLNRGLAYRQLKNDDLACRDFAKACELGECDGIQWAQKIKVCP
jgi:tetratricopeptide (TPR) repeat protein